VGRGHRTRGHVFSRGLSPNATGALPAVIYFHGGCFISGGFATHDHQLRQLAYHSGCRVIAVQYRLAPEHTFPAAHDDAEKGALIIHRHAGQLGIDASVLRWLATAPEDIWH
jgi:acetyl esterase